MWVQKKIKQPMKQKVKKKLKIIKTDRNKNYENLGIAIVEDNSCQMGKIYHILYSYIDRYEPIHIERDRKKDMRDAKEEGNQAEITTGDN